MDRSQLDICSHLDKEHQKAVEQNRAYLVPIVDTILTCARQNIAFRGHRGESGSVNAEGLEPVENDGNFRALLRYRIRGGDMMLQAHVQTAKANVTYQSPDIQNAIISSAGELVKDAVLRRIRQARFWALVADETTDRHNREQLAVVIRYLLPDEYGVWHCYEDPIAIVDVFSNIMASNDQSFVNSEIRLSGIAIGETLLRIVSQLGLNLSTCVGQGYDGASALSSERVGAAARFLVDAPNAPYYHCAMHCLNLSAAKAVSNPAIRHAQDIIKETTTCFRSSAKRMELLKAFIADADDNRISKNQLITMCTTRFIERHTSVVCFRSLIQFIMGALDSMTSWESSEARKTANILKNSIAQSDFVMALIILENVCGMMLPTTRLLQTVGLDLVQAMSGVDDLLSALYSMRSAECFSKLFQEAGAVADMLGISLVKPRTTARSVYRSASSGNVNDTVEDYYRVNIFFPTLDGIIQDLKLRFGMKQQQAMHLCCLIPAFMGFKDGEQDIHWQKVETAIHVYAELIGDPAVVTKSEFLLWRRKWEQVPHSERPISAVSTLDQCNSNQFPNVSLLLQILGTLPITTAEAERLFSKVERTLTAIRATMEETRLEALLMLQIHRMDTPTIDAVITHFATSSARRLNFVL